MALDNRDIPDPFVAWLEHLKWARSGFRFGSYFVELHDGIEGAHHQRGTASNVCEASADQCCALESRACEPASTAPEKRSLGVKLIQQAVNEVDGAMNDPEAERMRLLGEVARLVACMKELPPVRPGYEKYPYSRAGAHWQSIAALVKDAAEWFSLFAGNPNVFGSKPWLQMQLRCDGRAANAWPIDDLERDLRFIQLSLVAAGGRINSDALGMAKPSQPAASHAVESAGDGVDSPSGWDSKDGQQTVAELAPQVGVPPSANAGGTDVRAASHSRGTGYIRPKRTPDLKRSRERIALYDRLAQELATIGQELTGCCSVEGLKGKFPRFTLWTLIEDCQIQEIVNGDPFKPKAYAASLTLAKFGLTSRDTLKKDRQKLKRARTNEG